MSEVVRPRVDSRCKWDRYEVAIAKAITMITMMVVGSCCLYIAQVVASIYVLQT